MADRLNIVLRSSREITASVTPEAVWRAAKPESTADVEIPEDVNSFSREAIIAKLNGNPNYFVRNQYERLRILPSAPEVGIVRIGGITRVVRLELGLAALLTQSPIDLETAYLNAAQQEEDEDSQNKAIQQDVMDEAAAAAPGWNFAGEGVTILHSIWLLARHRNVREFIFELWDRLLDDAAEELRLEDN